MWVVLSPLEVGQACFLLQRMFFGWCNWHPWRCHTELLLVVENFGCVGGMKMGGGTKNSCHFFRSVTSGVPTCSNRVAEAGLERA